MEKLDKYEILQLIGSGATADVYRSHDLNLEREVALKVLKPSLVADAGAYRRFMQEARSAAGLFHPFIATVLEMGEAIRPAAHFQLSQLKDGKDNASPPIPGTGFFSGLV